MAGTSLVRVGELNVGATGLPEIVLQSEGWDYDSVIVPQGDRPGYMPGAAEVTLILHAERRTRRVLGAQLFGPGAVDKRVDILAVAITAGMTVDQVANLDLGYAPPFAPAMDVVITAANVLRSKLDRQTAAVMPHHLEAARAEGATPVLVDCRELSEWRAGRLSGAQHIPLGQLAARCGEVPGGCDVVVYCKGGLRSAEGYRKLKQAGFEQVRYLSGGMTAWTGEVER